MIAFIAGCSQPDGPVGSSVGGDPGGRTATRIATSDRDTSFAVSRISTGGSVNIYVGSAHGISSEGLLRFNRPDMPDTFSVDSARFDLFWDGGIGAGHINAWQVSYLHTEWGESSIIDPDTLPEGQPFDFRVIPSSDSSGSIEILMSKDEVEAWFARIDSIETDTIDIDSALTIRLRAIDAVEWLARFRSGGASTDDSLKPRLKVFVTIRGTSGADSQVTVTALPDADQFLLTGFPTETHNRIVIGSGVAFRSVIRFDMSPLETRSESFHIVVNHAEMTLYRDRTVFQWAPVTLAISPFRMIDDRWLTEPDSMGLSAFTIKTTPVIDDIDSLNFLVTPLAAEWIEDDNFGIALFSSAEGNDINRIAFHASNDPDVARRPKLTVHFTEIER